MPSPVGQLGRTQVPTARATLGQAPHAGTNAGDEFAVASEK